MPTRLSDTEFVKLLGERDLFKLAIRGHAAIEGEIDAALQEAFVGGIPRDLNSLSFRTRLALVVALGIVPQNCRDMFAALAKLGHDFAHANIEDITHRRAQSLVSTFPRWMPKDLRAAATEGGPRLTLVVVLIFARAVIASCARAARERREALAQVLSELPPATPEEGS